MRSTNSAFLLIVFLSIIFVNSQTINTCGNECEYSIIDDKLSIEVNGDITKNDWENTEGITSISIEGILNEYPRNFIQQFPSLQRVEINTKTIPKGLFSSTSIREVIIGENVESISDGTFEDCERLFTVTFSLNSNSTKLNHLHSEIV